MSYILDALRKADAERARGAVPDLHAQPVLRSSAGTAPSAGVAPWVWVAGTVALMAACGLAWLLLARDAPREPAGAAAVANVAAPATLLPPPLPAPTAPIVAAPAPPLAVAVAPRRPAPQAGALARPAPEPARLLPRKPVADPAGMSPPAPVPAPAPVPVRIPAPAPAAPQTPAEPRLYAQAELPDEIRRALPALAIGGAMYSQNAASRMLIINGQVFHERDKLAPELTLLQIKLKTAVLEYRGYRYSVSY